MEKGPILVLNPRGDLRAGCGLRTGSVVRATVIFASASAAHLKLDSGAVIRAALEGTAAPAEGEETLFLVRENDGRRIVLTPVGTPDTGWTGPGGGGEAADPAQLPPPEGEPRLLDAIGHCGCAPTKELAGEAAAILAEFPEALAETAVVIAAGGLAPEAENIGIGNALNRSSFQVGQELGRIVSLLFAGLPEEAEAARASAPEVRGRAGTDFEIPGGGPGGKQKFDPEAVSRLAEGLFARGGEGCSGKELREAAAGLPARIDALRRLAETAGDAGARGAGAGDAGAGGAGRLTGRVAAAVKYMSAIPGFAYVQIPLLYRGAPETAELYVLRRRERRRGTEQGELRAILALDMKNMGHVETLLRFSGRGLSLRFTANGKNQAKFLAERSGQLRGLLYRAGYEPLEISSAVSPGKTGPAGAMEALRRERPGGSGKIDLKI
ncbi:MAG: flagellar hook-length control protein FliK [Oscillospiraceae bacterium]|nr:flagellar hook-length control protein FliK [Oscillospiraceae bacterium]